MYVLSSRCSGGLIDKAGDMEWGCQMVSVLFLYDNPNPNKLHPPLLTAGVVDV